VIPESRTPPALSAPSAVKVPSPSQFPPDAIDLAAGVPVRWGQLDGPVLDLEPIARALAHVCRFGGRCRRFYSVAEHSLLVAEFCRRAGAPPEVQLAGLLHDAEEAWTGDVPTPWKPRVPELVAWGERLRAAILAAHGARMAPVVKAGDLSILAAEAHELLESQGQGWPVLQGIEAPRWAIVCVCAGGAWPCEIIRMAWLAEVERLKRQIGEGGRESLAQSRRGAETAGTGGG